MAETRAGLRRLPPGRLGELGLHLPNLEPERGDFKAWLRTLASRHVVDRLRKRRERLAQSAELESLPDATPPIEDRWEEVWTCQHVASYLEKTRTRVSSQTFELFALLNDEGARRLPVIPSPPRFVDTNGDNLLSPLDVLLVIDFLATPSEGESGLRRDEWVFAESEDWTAHLPEVDGNPASQF